MSLSYNSRLSALQRYRMSSSVAAPYPYFDDRSSSSAVGHHASWWPEWMGTSSWIANMKLPPEFDLFVAACEEGEDPRSSCLSGQDAPLKAPEHWALADMRDKWYPLLGNVARAVTQQAPWSDPRFTKPIRQEILLAVLKRFLEHAPDRDVMAAQTREVLYAIQKEDPMQEMQLSLIEFMNGQPWDGVTDSYRTLKNFKGNQSEYGKFKNLCDDKVQKRLHAINTEGGKTESMITEAMNRWQEIQETCACLCEADASSNDDSEGVPGTAPPCLITVEVDRITVSGVNPSTGKPATLPEKALVSVSFLRNGRVISEGSEMEGRFRADYTGTRDDAPGLVWRGSSAAVSVPRMEASGRGFSAIDKSFVRVDVGSIPSCGCGLFTGQSIAQFDVPLSSLFTGATPLHSKQRRMAAEKREACGDKREYGLHFCHKDFADPDTGLSLRATFSMTCCNEKHNKAPLRVNLLQELKRREQHDVVSCERRWDIDHHYSLIELAGVLGDLNDARAYALQLYSDRFLLDDELQRVVCLASYATRGTYNEVETREAMLASLETLIELLPDLRTVVAEEIASNAINHAKQQLLERLVIMNEVCRDPTSGVPIFNFCLQLSTLLGIDSNHIDAVITSSAEEYASYLSRKLHKLYYLIPQNALGDPRMSALVELAQKEDASTLLAKSRAFYEIVDECLTVINQGLEFAQATKDSRIEAMITTRSDIILRSITDPMNRALTAFIGELAKARLPDPLGDAFGVLVLLYERVMRTISLLQDVPALGKHCVALVAGFDNLLPVWFTLCERKVTSWVLGIIKAEPLTPIMRGKVSWNGAPGDAENLLGAIYTIFDKVLDWIDPSFIHVYVTSFCKLLFLFSEQFCKVLVNSGACSILPEEWLVCLCSIEKYGTIIQLLWQDKVIQGMCRSLGDADGLLHYQCQTLKAETAAMIDELKDELAAYIGANMKRATTGLIEEAMASDRTADPVEKGSVLYNSLKSCFTEELQIIISNTDKVTAPRVMVQCAKGVHNGLIAYVTDNSALMLQPAFRALVLQVLSAVEEALGQFNGYDQIPPDIIFDLNNNSRFLVQMAGEASETLIETLDGKRGAPPTDFERTRILSLLSHRTDRVAQRYLRSLK